MVRRLTRREFLKRSAAAGVGLSVATRVPLALAAGPGPETAFATAMHIHASFSENTGSMEKQLWQAQNKGVDVLWWTEHDWRMANFAHRRAVQFTSLVKDLEDGNPAKWIPWIQDIPGATVEIATPPSASGGGGTAMHLDGRAAVPDFKAFDMRLAAKAASNNYKSSLVAGPKLAIEVYPVHAGPNGFLEIAVLASGHREDRLDPVTGLPLKGSRISYRIGGPDAPGTRRREGNKGIVSLPFTMGTWNHFELDLLADFTACFADLAGYVAGDNSLSEIDLAIQSRNDARAQGWFDWLTWDYGKAGRTDQQFFLDQFQAAKDLGAGYAADFPGVTQHFGTEVSYWVPHLNWFGGSPSLYPYTTVPARKTNYAYVADAVARAHTTGGLVSYNHLYGPAVVRPAADGGESVRPGIAGRMLAAKAYGADILEVGYPQRGKADMTRHLMIWDALARGSVWLTGNGVTDDHTGNDWLDFKNNFLTFIYADAVPGPTEANLLPSLAGGRAFFADPKRFGIGASKRLDVATLQGHRMGNVVANAPSTVDLVVTASGLPSGTTVKLVQGAIDSAYPATGNADPLNLAPQLLPASNFAATGDQSVTLSTRPDAAWAGSYVRTEVLDAAGTRIALSNPIYFYAGTPPEPIPGARVPGP